MKLHALILACATSLLASPAMAETRISFDFFYDSLSPYGDWCDTDRYGRVWQPHGVDRDWSPYSDGYWSYTDAGWTWVSYEDFGGITYHYGRWIQLDEVGWCWVPGYEWGPAWVSWRRSDDYVGWAPLPPEARWEVRVGFSSWVDTHYDIGPGYYSFCRVRDFGAPVIRHVIVPRTRNVTIINVTTNITNITYNRDNGYIFNGGLDYDYIAPRCAHSLPALKLVQNTTNNIFINNNKGNVFVNTQRGNALYVAAPPVAENNYNVLTRTAPPARVYKAPSVSRGWAGLDKDGVREKLLVKMRDEVKGATPETAPARAFRPESIAVVPKKADPTAPRPSLLRATAKRDDARDTDGPSILKKPIVRPEPPRIEKDGIAGEPPRPAIDPEPRPGTPKQPVTRPQVSVNDPEHDGKPGVLKRPIVRPDTNDNEKEAPVRPAQAPTVLKKPREDVRETPERPAAKPNDDGDARRKMAEQAERAAQESRARDLAKQRENENERRMVVEKQRRAAEQQDAQRAAEETERRKQSAAIEQQRRAADAEKMQRKQIESQRAAEENARRQQAAAAVEKQRRSEQDNFRRAQEENARRAAAESQKRMQAEISRRAADEARQRQAEASRRASDEARQQQAAEAFRKAQIPQRPSGGSSSRPLTPEEQAAIQKKKSSRQ